MHTHQADEDVHILFPNLQFHQQTNGPNASHHDKVVDLQNHPTVLNKILIFWKINIPMFSILYLFNIGLYLFYRN